MTDYGHDLLFGVFVPPSARDHRAVTDMAVRADALGLDLFAVQDHPYQPAFLDTWTLLSALAPVTRRIRLVPDVVNLPLRPPAVLARSAATLDVLSGGRVELGLGAGALWDAIEANGGPRRTPREALEALEEAIAIVRALWTPGPAARVDGRHYRVWGAKPGPEPLHPIGVWVGGYGTRMLRLVGRVADGWIPSSAYLPPDRLGARTRVLDAAAEDAGRDPAQIRRVYNVDGAFEARASGFLRGPAETWAEQLTELALEHGISAFVLAAAPGATSDLERFASEVAPAVRAAVARARTGAPTPARSAASVPARDAAGHPNQQMLLQVHDELRRQLAELREAVELLARGNTRPEDLRSTINRLAMRQNYMSLGTFCAAYCRFVASHHTVEDRRMFPDLLAADPSLEPVIERLEREHDVIARIVVELDDAVVALMQDPARIDDVRAVADRLAGELLAHLALEEDALLPALGTLPSHV